MCREGPGGSCSCVRGGIGCGWVGGSGQGEGGVQVDVVAAGEWGRVWVGGVWVVSGGISSWRGPCWWGSVGGGWVGCVWVGAPLPTASFCSATAPLPCISSHTLACSPPLVPPQLTCTQTHARPQVPTGCQWRPEWRACVDEAPHPTICHKPPPPLHTQIIHMQPPKSLTGRRWRPGWRGC